MRPHTHAQHLFPYQEDNILKVNPVDFIYDEVTDTIKPLDTKVFEALVEDHPAVHKLRRGDKRDEKIAALKTKVLDTLKVTERRKRNLSCESISSDCPGWGLEDPNPARDQSRGSVRKRSEEENLPHVAKKPHHQSRPLLKPPKILVSKQ